MRKEIKLKNAIGEIFNGFEFSYEKDQLVLSFGNDLFSTIGIDYGYEIDDITLCEEELNFYHFGDNNLISAKIESKENIKKIRCNYEKQIEEERIKLVEKLKNNEYEEYQRLKKIYG